MAGAGPRAEQPRHRRERAGPLTGGHRPLPAGSDPATGRPATGPAKARALGNLGHRRGPAGRYGRPIDYYAAGPRTCRQAGDADDRGLALNNLGDVEVRSGRYSGRPQHLQQALTLFRQLGNRYRRGRTLDSLGVLHTGRPARPGDRALPAGAGHLPRDRRPGRRGLGAQRPRRGRTRRRPRRRRPGPPHRRPRHRHRHRRPPPAGPRPRRPRPHLSPATPPRARTTTSEALALYTDLGLPEADQIRTQLRRAPAHLTVVNPVRGRSIPPRPVDPPGGPG